MIVPLWVITVFGVYLLTSLVASVWWASNIATTLNFMRTSIDKLETKIGSLDGYVTKPELVKEVTVLEKSIEASWKKIEKLEDSVNGKLMGGNHG